MTIVLNFIPGVKIGVELFSDPDVQYIEFDLLIVRLTFMWGI